MSDIMATAAFGGCWGGGGDETAGSDATQPWHRHTGDGRFYNEDDQPPMKRRCRNRNRNRFNFLPTLMSELRVVLLGNSWPERRDVGNFILGKTKFNTEEEPDCCLTVRRQIEDKKIVLINTPALLLPNISEDKLKKHVRNCVRLSDPGPHVFLLVLQPEDFTEEHKERLCRVLQLFSDRSFDHSVILISKPREESSGVTEQHPAITDMVSICRYRHLLQKKCELSELLTLLGQTVTDNNGEHLSCDGFDQDEDFGLSTRSEHIRPSLTLELFEEPPIEKQWEEELTKQNEWWEKRYWEDEQRRQKEQEKLKTLKEAYEQEREKYENKRKEENRRRREQEVKEKIELKGIINDMKKKYEEEVRKQTEKFNDKNTKDLEALKKNHEEELKALKEQHEKSQQEKQQELDNLKRKYEEIKVESHRNWCTVC